MGEEECGIHEELACEKREMREPKWPPTGRTTSQAILPQIKDINKTHQRPGNTIYGCSDIQQTRL